MPKRGENIYHRKDGRWEGRMYLNGTRKYRSVYGKNYRETKEKLGKLKSENAVVAHKCGLTVEEVMMGWLSSVKIRAKESSIGGYRTKLNVHILPYYKGIKFDRLTAVDADRFTQEKLAAGLSAKYVSDMVVMLKSASKWAAKNLGCADVFSLAELPKVKRKEPVLLEISDQKKLKNTLEKSDDTTSLGVFLAVYSGVRIGELCALKWSDIDLKNGVLHISKTVQRISVEDEKSKTAVMITTPKTEKSVRDIPLPKFVVQKLKRFRRSGECYLLSGTKALVEPRCFTNRFKRLLKKAGVPSIRFHALRHCFATSCLQCGFDIKTLSEILGHAGADTTMRIYVHSSMERKRECMAMLTQQI